MIDVQPNNQERKGISGVGLPADERSLWIRCSDNGMMGDESFPPKAVFHENLANLVAVTNMNFLATLQFAVDVYCVESIIVCGHHGCRGVALAIDGPRLDLVASWLRPVANLAFQYRAQLEHLGTESDRLDALCELNVVEQVAALHQTSVVREARSRGRKLAVRGLIYEPGTDSYVELDSYGADGSEQFPEGDRLIDTFRTFENRRNVR